MKNDSISDAFDAARRRFLLGLGVSHVPLVAGVRGHTYGKPVATIEQGHMSSASCILANLSQKLGRSLTWDAGAGKITGDDEANGLLARKYRAPWEHPA